MYKKSSVLYLKVHFFSPYYHVKQVPHFVSTHLFFFSEILFLKKNKLCMRKTIGEIIPKKKKKQLRTCVNREFGCVKTKIRRQIWDTKNLGGGHAADDGTHSLACK